MLKNSITLYVLIWLKSLFSFKESIIYNSLLNLAAKINSVFKKSIIRNTIVGETRYFRLYESSVIYYFGDKLVSSIVSALKKAYSYFNKATEKSVVRNLICAITKKEYFRFEYICALMFALMMIVPGNMWNNAYAVIIAGVLGIWYFALYISGRNFAFGLRKISVSLFAFVVATIGAVFITPDRFDGMRIAMFYAASVVFMLVVSGIDFNENSLKRFVSILLGALFIMCVYAIYQNRVGVGIDARLTDIENNSGMPGRVYSTFENPNNFAEVIVMLMPFVYAMILCTKRKLSKAVFILVFFVCLLALLMTYSRSCYIAFAISTVVFVFIYDWRLIIPLGFVAILCIPLLPESVMNRIFTIGSMDDSSNSYRVYIWKGVIDLIKDKGLSGIGIGPQAFAKLYPSFADLKAIKAPHSHMLYLEIFLELGIVGFLGFFGLMYASLKKGLSAVNRTGKTARCMIIASVSSFAGISFTACAEYIWFYPRVMFVFWIVLGILLASACLKRKNPV